MAQELWDRLRATGLQELAPELFDEGPGHTPGCPGIADPGGFFDGSSRRSCVVAWRRRSRSRLAGRTTHASWPAALEAALPQNRAAALCELKAAILAATTRPSVDSLLKMWRELSAAWEIPPWPLTVTLVHSLGASFKRGRYQSCSLYFGAAIAHQLRTLGLPVGEEIRFAVKDTVRAIKRGLGPSQLKDSFDFEALKALVDPAAELRAFDPEDLGAMLDMLREIEISNARLWRLCLEGGDLVHLLVPISKADTCGSLTVRSYLCVCRARVELLYPYHAAKRHLARMNILVETKGECEFLFPDRELQPLRRWTSSA